MMPVLLIDSSTFAILRVLIICGVSVVGCLSRAAHAQSNSLNGSELKSTEDGTVEPQSNPLTYIAPKTIEMLVGVRVTAGNGNMIGTLATTVFPTDWPEQKVVAVEANVPPTFRYDFRDLPNNNRQVLFRSQLISGNTVVEATLKVRIEKQHIVGPEDTTAFVLPRRLPNDMKIYLGNSPFIEADNAEIRRIVREVDASKPLNEWKRIEALYDWVRENIAYENGDLKTVREALKDRTGDCEEMTSTFVALCRAARVPARVVWIPNHCYPEFYLADENGDGHWFPCQVAGTRNFGSMPEYLPILQKGDRFKVPERNEMQRYIMDFLKSDSAAGSRKPQVEFIRQLLGDAATLRAPDLNGEAN
jgi:hypothetical protein